MPDPGEPVVHGQLLVGHRRRRLRGRGDAEGAPLWWPQGKIAGEYLPRWLAEHGVAPPASQEPPQGGVNVRRTLRALRGAEAQHLFDLAHRLDSSDPAVASLGRACASYAIAEIGAEDVPAGTATRSSGRRAPSCAWLPATRRARRSSRRC